MKYAVVAVAIASVAVVACSRQPPAAPSPLIPTASIQEIMNSHVDPAADFLWEAVSTEVTLQGTVEHRPESDAEWFDLRHAAIRLIESANLLVMDGRRVASEGHTLEDAHVPGISSAEDIQQAIDADRPAFFAHAHELHAAASQILQAVDARDTHALVEAGGKLDEACESCHLKYWYPNAPLPPELAAQR